jgi:carbonic anhydrase
MRRGQGRDRQRRTGQSHRAAARIKPAVEATSYSGERSANNCAFVDAVARKNVEMTVADIRKDSDVLAELEAQGTIKITSAIYNLETGAVEFLG